MEHGDVLSDALCNETAVDQNDLALRHNVGTLNSVSVEVLCVAMSDTSTFLASIRFTEYRSWRRNRSIIDMCSSKHTHLTHFSYRVLKIILSFTGISSSNGAAKCLYWLISTLMLPFLLFTTCANTERLDVEL